MFITKEYSRFSHLSNQVILRGFHNYVAGMIALTLHIFREWRETGNGFGYLRDKLKEHFAPPSQLTCLYARSTMNELLAPTAKFVLRTLYVIVCPVAVYTIH